MYKKIYNIKNSCDKGANIMEKCFSVILSELRKEQGLSQKEVAENLGISQALLSHYEKGIRECGHSFLIKVADFYGVTCDYLLGRSEVKNGNKELTLQSEDEQDEKAGIRTAYKAARILKDMLMHDAESGFDFENLITLELYRVILLEAHAGRLPKNWAGRAYTDGGVCYNSLFLDVIEKTTEEYIKPQNAKEPMDEKPAPKSLETTVKRAEELVLRYFAERIPPIPYEFVK